jgi:hypothetical protein
MFLARFVEKTKTHFIFSTFLGKCSRVLDNVEKYSNAGRAIDVSMARGHSMLGN